jgi:CRISPR/Cas system-associated exonuclease Cas4 (RecB family)
MYYQRDDYLGEQLLTEAWEEFEDSTREHPSVTDLIYCLTRKYYDVTNPGVVEVSPQTKMMFIIGLGLESVLLTKRRMVFAAGEKYGIHYHIDSLDRDVLVELKTTRMSAKTTPDQFPESWVTQLKSYCYLAETTQAKVAVLHIIPPALNTWEIQFTREELDDHWEWMLKRKRVWDKAVETEIAPAPFVYNLDWECKNCAYKIVCDLQYRRSQEGYHV